jgi:hypothetical protein
MRALAFISMALVSISSTVYAQSPHRRPVGLGVGINSDFDIRLPLRLGSRWRLEPSIGLLIDKVTLTTLSAGQPDQHSEASLRNWRFALLIAGLVSLDSSSSLYIGPRLSLVRSSTDQELDFGSGTSTTVSVARLDKEVGLVSGAEAALGSHLTLGAEVSLTFLFRGDASIDPLPLPPGVIIGFSESGHKLATGAAVVVRWFVGRPH